MVSILRPSTLEIVIDIIMRFPPAGDHTLIERDMPDEMLLSQVNPERLSAGAYSPSWK